MVLAMTGVAALSAIATAMLAPGGGAVAPATITTQVVAAAPPIQYVQLQPGQTAPSGAFVVQPGGPVPTPRTIVITTTRQSGRP